MAAERQDTRSSKPSSSPGKWKQQTAPERLAPVLDLPRRNVRIEQQLVASILHARDGGMDPAEVFTECTDLVRPDDLLSPNCHIWQAFAKLAARNLPILTSTVWSELEAMGVTGEDGSLETILTFEAAYYASAFEYVDSPYGLAVMVQEDAIGRKLGKLAGDLAGVGRLASLKEMLASWDALVLEGDARLRYAQLAQEDDALVSDVEAQQMPKPEPLVGEWISQRSVGWMYGDSDTYKTFLGIDIGLSIGTPALETWHGAKLAHGTVLYVAAEAPETIGERITAWKRQHGLPLTQETDFYLWRKPVNLLNEAEVAAFIRRVKLRLEDLALVVFDTVAMSMGGGEEKDAKDINAVYASAHAIRDAFGCSVLFVDHVTHEQNIQKGPIGSIRKRTNADDMISVERMTQTSDPDAVGTIRIKSRKHKGAASPDPLMLRAVKTTWATEDGATQQSLALVESALAVPDEEAKGGKRPSPRKIEAALRILQDNPEGLIVSHWQELAATLPKADSMSKQTFYDCRDALELDGRVVKRGKLYFAVPSDAD